MSMIRDIKRIDRRVIQRLKNDGVYFAEKILGITLHYYQKEVMNEKHRFIAMCWSRQIGKCIGGGTELISHDGSIITADELRVGDRIITMDDDGKLIPSEPILVEENGVKSIIKVTTAMGREIEVTYNHPFLTVDGYVDAHELSVGNRVAMSRNIDIEGEEILSDKEITFLGLMTGDGNFSKNIFTNTDKQILRNFLWSIDDQYTSSYIDKRSGAENIIFGKGYLTELVEKLGLKEVRADGKFIPDVIFRSSKRQIALFLSKLIDTDGHVSKLKNGSVYIEYCSRSEKLIHDMTNLFVRLGIYAKKFKKLNKKYDRYYHYLSISSSINMENVLKWLRLTPRKQEILDDVRLTYRDHIDTFPQTIQIKELIKRTEGMSYREIERKYGISLRKMDKYSLTYAKFLELKKVFPYIEINTNIFWDKIVKIERLEPKMTYGVEVPHTHNHVTNQFITHNTFLLAVKATHYAVTNPDKLIMVLSQDRERAKEFYNLILSFITSTPILANMIIGDPKQSETKLDNGTRIINKAAGRDGRSLRGYSVDLLIIDEADFIPDPVFVAGEQCTSSTRGNIWLISTPFKKATTFYKYFTDGLEARRKYNGEIPLEEDEKPYDEPIGRKYGFKVYHHDWTAGVKAYKPNGQTQIDEEFIRKKKMSMAKWEFEQEYLAIWSDDIASYFNERQIRNCINMAYKKEDYIYEREYNKQVIYVGIDFAKHKDRTVLVCIGKQHNGVYKVLFTYEMQGRDWDKQLIRINNIMSTLRPNLIFVDKTGLGDVMFDLMSKSDVMPDGSKNEMHGYIVDVTMTIQKKVSLYTHLQYMIGNQLIELPNHKRMIKELIFLQYEKTSQSEWVKIFAPNTSDDIHDDYPDALALACHGTKDDVMYFPITMRSIRKLNIEPVHRKNINKHKQFTDDEEADRWEAEQIRRGAVFKVLGGSGANSKRTIGGYNGRKPYRRRNLHR